jgi:hypothetical protein
VVLDLHLHTVSVPKAGMDALATIRMIKNGWPATRIVVLTMYATSRAPVLEAGADAFLLLAKGKRGPNRSTLALSFIIALIAVKRSYDLVWARESMPAFGELILPNVGYDGRRQFIA